MTIRSRAVLPVQSFTRAATCSCLILALILAGCSSDTEQSNTPAPDTSTPPVVSQTNTVPAPPSEPIDLSYIPAESAVGVIVRVRELLDLEMTKWLPIEVAEAVTDDRPGRGGRRWSAKPGLAPLAHGVGIRQFWKTPQPAPDSRRGALFK